MAMRDGNWSPRRAASWFMYTDVSFQMYSCRDEVPGMTLFSPGPAEASFGHKTPVGVNELAKCLVAIKQVAPIILENQFPRIENFAFYFRFKISIFRRFPVLLCSQGTQCHRPEL